MTQRKKIEHVLSPDNMQLTSRIEKIHNLIKCSERPNFNKDCMCAALFNILTLETFRYVCTLQLVANSKYSEKLYVHINWKT